MYTLLPLIVAQSLLQVVQSPVLEFPEAGVDDPAAYEGYSTRFFWDAHRNAFQIYINAEDGRVVHVWADAANASAAFTVRGADGGAARMRWGGAGAVATTDGSRRVMRYRLESERHALEFGWFLLGTMRQERDYQYWGWPRRPYGDGRFVLEEFAGLVSSLERLPPDERDRHLALLNARDLTELRSRLEPRVTFSQDDTGWRGLVEHTTLDGRNQMTLELHGDAATTTAHLADDVISVRSHSSTGITVDVTVTTDHASLTPLRREQIFNPAFEAFFARERRASDGNRGRAAAFRRLERGALGLELLSTEDKLMAALPNYATYFGRDMMMAALMLEPISSVGLQEHVIANVLRKVSPGGDVSHEEALGGQAIREHAAEYNTLIAAWDEARARNPDAAARHLAHARELLESPQAVRENFHMIDDDFQLPILVDRYLARSDVSRDRKQRFLEESGPRGARRLDALLRNLALVAELAEPYAERPEPANLVGFLRRDSVGWLPGSWRDSRAGYGNGRFAMDVNVVWVPNALAASARILTALESLGLSLDDAISRVPNDVSALQAYRRAPRRLGEAVATWRSSRRHFVVTLDTATVRRRVEQSLALRPAPEREYWLRRFQEDGARRQPLSFLTLALDDDAQPIPAANTDVATDLFLEDYTEQIVRGDLDPDAVIRMLDVVVRSYPVGLLVEGLGPLVVNDLYASPAVQQAFAGDLYHSSKVVWGREVNLLLLGLARQIHAAYDPAGQLRDDRPEIRAYVDTLRQMLETTLAAVEESGMRHNELWSYRIENDTLRPVRYGTSSDIQLWNLTDLAVRFMIHRLPLE